MQEDFHQCVYKIVLNVSFPNSRNNHNSQQAAVLLIDITLIPGGIYSVIMYFRLNP